jgi:hypothetical protein
VKSDSAKTVQTANGKGQMANGLGFKKPAIFEPFEFCHLPFAI